MGLGQGMGGGSGCPGGTARYGALEWAVEEEPVDLADGARVLLAALPAGAAAGVLVEQARGAAAPRCTVAAEQGVRNQIDRII